MSEDNTAEFDDGFVPSFSEAPFGAALGGAIYWWRCK